MAEEQSESLLHTGEVPRRTTISKQWYKRRIAIAVLFVSTVSLLFGLFSATRSSSTHSPPPIDESLVVTLPGYGRFQGTQFAVDMGEKTPSKSVDAWLSLEYSTQPVDQDRFKPVTWPAAFRGTRFATSYGPACFQNPHVSDHQSEACLTVNVYRPSGTSLDDKLPVFVFLHGGAFIVGSGRSFDGARFVAKSSQPLIVVTAQYRLGALGSLPSKLMEEEGLLNLGLRDQRLMLEFMQKYVGRFGGDAERITLGGQSAGGHAVGIHQFHNYGADTGKPLFNQTILASGSETARAFPGVDYPLYQRHFTQFMDYVNCPTTPNAAALACLRALEADDIQFVASGLFSASNYNVTWPFQPVSPGPLFEKRGSTSGENGTFFALPTLISSCANEGTFFAPQDLRTNADFLNFWRTLTPGLTSTDLTDLETLYPDPSNSSTTADPISPQYARTASALGDYSYICPVQETARRLAAARAPVYKARFNTPNHVPAYQGVPHASDAAYFNGKPGTQYPGVADVYSAYYASFIVSGNPNTYRAEGAPVWEVYQGVGGRQMGVSPLKEGGVRMEGEGEGMGKGGLERCAWWRDGGRAGRLNK
ncbi:alpha/beta-hydrolase [Dothidotthia symphoricarpi CBS 119687]|uniref:Carboxylic ester hydrolase n=1 Tax=Dothidotthia symphoricarpi CBS 119687 TaxID=1392245 RepID=A0A6A6A6B5_9PLEO|nr:alpha/beta-hydrolase [Dothidotthia symphoricarpi CBS 119687]KAF2126161.1 alpha/beta-hydrolase [Dothidotthia symphoricarpi CBS 119687]